MAKHKPKSPEEMAAAIGRAEISPRVQFINADVIEARQERAETSIPAPQRQAVVRSARGVDKETWKNVCFRLEPDRAQAIKMHCVSRDIDLHVFMHEVLQKAGF